MADTAGGFTSAQIIRRFGSLDSWHFKGERLRLSENRSGKAAVFQFVFNFIIFQLRNFDEIQSI